MANKVLEKNSGKVHYVLRHFAALKCKRKNSILTMNKKEIAKKAFKTSLPVMAGYMVLGAGFGMVLKSAGYGIIWALAMSVFIYAGSMQFVAINLLTGGASFITTAITTLLVNARHLFYGISMINKYKGAGKRKPYLIFALTDETYSLVCNGEYPEETDKYKYWFFVSLFNQIYWISGSLIGSLLGSVIKFDTTGIDFSMTALFVTVFVEQWLSTKEHRPALIGLAASAICLVIFGSEKFLIPAMVLILVFLMLFKKSFDKEAHND